MLIAQLTSLFLFKENNSFNFYSFSMPKAFYCSKAILLDELIGCNRD
jgi:hypothetical protein